MIKIAVVGCWHVHTMEYAQQIQEAGNACIACVWDDDAERGAQMAKELGCGFTMNCSDVLNDGEIDAIIITSATSQHTELMIAAAKAKKHIFTEKVLALTEKECLQIKTAVKENDIKFCISFPWMVRPGILYAKQTADSGILGDVMYARVRNAHGGTIEGWLPDRFYNLAECGGGAMMDLGAHGMYLLHWIFGEPEKAASVFTNVTKKQVEDNAVAVMSFAGGAIGVNETAFVCPGDPFSMEISGTKGGLRVYENGENAQYRFGSGEWMDAQLPPREKMPIYQWLDDIETGQKNLFDLDRAVILTRMMKLAYNNRV